MIVKEIIKVLPDQIRFVDNTGDRCVRPNTPYYRQKILKSKGRRIRHTFGKGAWVKETYNDMIFNAELAGVPAQIRSNYANQLCEAIEQDDIALYQQIFTDHDSLEFDTKLLDSAIEMFGDRVKVVNDGFVVDDLFLVDRKGTAWVWDYETNTKMIMGNGGCKSLCIVVKKMPAAGFVDGKYQVDSLIYTVLSKVMYLMDPDMNDQVFTRQIPERHMEILERNNMILGKHIRRKRYGTRT